MIQIKNGKLTIAGTAFSLPENFFLHIFGGDEALTFRAENGAYIEIGAEASPVGAEQILLELLGENEPYAAASGVFPVQRAGRSGVAVYAFEKEGKERYYEERYPLDGNKQLYLIVGETGDGLFGKCDELLSQPEIKAFLQSVTE